MLWLLRQHHQLIDSLFQQIHQVVWFRYPVMKTVQKVLTHLNFPDNVSRWVVKGWFRQVLFDDGRFHLHDKLLVSVKRYHWKLAAVSCDHDFVLLGEMNFLYEPAALHLIIYHQVLNVQLTFVQPKQLHSVPKRHCKYYRSVLLEPFFVSYDRKCRNIYHLLEFVHFQQILLLAVIYWPPKKQILPKYHPIHLVDSSHLSRLWICADNLLDCPWVRFEIVTERSKYVSVIVLVAEFVLLQNLLWNHHGGQGGLRGCAEGVYKPVNWFGFLYCGHAEGISFGLSGKTEVIVEYGFAERGFEHIVKK